MSRLHRSSKNGMSVGKRSYRIAIDAVTLSKVVASLGPCLIPPAHMAVLFYFWKDYEYPVDRHKCSNSCWDTVFKGPYENGVASYKHMYFNATGNFLKIWLLTVSAIIAFYESIRYLTSLALHRRLRWSMFVLFSMSVYSNYYSWWGYVNYWNDEFYSQWNHQTFFTVTEFISTVVILDLSDKDKEITRRKTFAIVTIATLHVITGSYDQFVNNVIFGEGRKHQVVRDVALMLTDVLNMVVPLHQLAKREKPRLTDSETKRELLFSALFLVVAFLIYCFL